MTQERINKVKTLIFKYLNTKTPIFVGSTCIFYEGNVDLHYCLGNYYDSDKTLHVEPSGIRLEIRFPELDDIKMFTLSHTDFTKVEWAQIRTKFEELDKEFSNSLLDKLMPEDDELDTNEGAYSAD